MEFLTNLADGIWSNVIIFLLVLTLVVFIHELGHFLVARWCGVVVKAFSIGFGPEIFGFYDRHGTRWRFAWIPLGGYVKFMDDDNAASMPSREALERMTADERKSTFHTKPVWQRAAVVVAGPMANFLLAIAIYAGLNMAVGIRVMPAYVEKVVPDSPAAKAGFEPGDKIVAIDAAPVESFEDLQRIVAPNAGRELTFKVERNGETIDVKVTPAMDEQRDPFGRNFKRGLIGIQRSNAPEKWQTYTVGPIDAVARGVQETWSNISQTVAGLGDMISGRQSAEQMGGPILMAEVTAKVAGLGIEPLLRWIALISANIGFLNLLPIPVLDGGHLLFYGVEAIRRKPLSDRFQQVGFQIGLAFIIALMIFVNFNDLTIFLRRMLGAS
ncbi:MAG TPA: RIP metalloprotease RseP [Hyphomicrobium sp.]|nr:RIP metalloprotease RseP [Hyphomicrobium sp.]